MAKTSTYYGLHLPEPADSYNIEPVSGNFNAIDRLLRKASGFVYTESSSSTTLRTVQVDFAASWDDLIGVPLSIKAAVYGVASTTTLNINGFGAKTLMFPSPGAATLSAAGVNYWVRTGGIYRVLWDGSSLQVLNPQTQNASTTQTGMVQLTESLGSTSNALAATAGALKTVYDLALQASQNVSLLKDDGIVMGTFSGNSTKGRIISVGFTPRLVVVCRANGGMNEISVSGSVRLIYGGIVGQGHILSGYANTAVTTWDDNTCALGIVSGGFKVNYAEMPNTQENFNVYIRSNEGTRYYIALR